MAKYVEVVPPPTEVDLVFYDENNPHISVAPASKHDDDRIVGVANVGLDKQLTYVCRGDAIITYPDGTVIVKPRDEALAYFAPKVEPELPALPAEAEVETLDDAVSPPSTKRRK